MNGHFLSFFLSSFLGGSGAGVRDGKRNRKKCRVEWDGDGGEEGEKGNGGKMLDEADGGRRMGESTAMLYYCSIVFVNQSHGHLCASSFWK